VQALGPKLLLGRSWSVPKGQISRPYSKIDSVNTDPRDTKERAGASGNTPPSFTKRCYSSRLKPSLWLSSRHRAVAATRCHPRPLFGGGMVSQHLTLGVLGDSNSRQPSRSPLQSMASDHKAAHLARSLSNCTRRSRPLSALVNAIYSAVRLRRQCFSGQHDRVRLSEFQGPCR